MGNFVRLYIKVFAFIVAFVPLAQAELPSVKVGTADLVSSSTTYYGSATTHTNSTGITARPAEIEELATGLGKGRHSNVDYARNIFEYVRNNIAVEFRYGLAKGAFGALLDQSGTPFDQAHLMVELLREGGVSATYKVGTITLTGAEFEAWTGIANAAAACRLLADGGIPAIVNGSTSASCSYGGNVSSVTLSHIWVSANSKLYDPSYKEHVFTAPSVTLATAMGCSGSGCGADVQSSLTTGATFSSTSGVPYARYLNQGTAETKLTQLATNLQTYLQTNKPNATLEEVIGGGILIWARSRIRRQACLIRVLQATVGQVIFQTSIVRRCVCGLRILTKPFMRMSFMETGFGFSGNSANRAAAIPVSRPFILSTRYWQQVRRIMYPSPET